VAVVQQAVGWVMAQVECQHCRRQFVDSGFEQMAQTVLDAIRKDIEAEERAAVKH
jgi:hypothetical protein